MAEQTVTLRIVAETGKLVGEVRVAKDALRGLGDEGLKASGSLDKAAASATSVENAAASMGRTIGLAAAAAAAGIAVMVKQQIDAADAAGKMAAKYGITVEAVSALQQAARSNGESLEAIPGLLDGISNSAAKAAAGARSQAADYKALGISLRDTATGGLKPTETLLGEVAQKLTGYRDGAAKTALANRLLGESGAALTLTLKNLGDQGLGGLKKQAEDVGRLINEETSQDAARFNDAIQGIQDRVAGAALSLGVELLPALTDIADGFVEFVDEARKSEALRTILSGTWEVIKAGVSVVRDLANELSALARDPTFLQFLDNTKRELEAIAAVIPKIDIGAPFRVEVSKPKWMESEWFKWLTSPKPGSAAAARESRFEQQRALDNGAAAAANNPFNGMDTAALLSASKPLLTDLAGLWQTVTGRVDEFGLHVAQAAEQTSKPDAPLPTLGRQASTAARAIDPLTQAQKSLDDQLDSLRGNFGETARAQADFDQGMRQLEANVLKVIWQGGDLDEALRKWDEGEALLATRLQRTTEELRRRDDIVGQLREQYDDEARLVGLSARAYAQEAAVISAGKKAREQYYAGSREHAELTKNEIDDVRNLAGAQYDLSKQANDLEEIMSRFGEIDGFEKLVDDIGKVEAALDKATDPAQIARLQRSLGGLRQEAMLYATDALGQGISSLKSMASEGSKAYQALEVAQTALNLATAIGAIANQGLGDPYTAFARIAAMAAMMAQIVDGIGNIAGGGGPSSSSAEVRQQAQGTGSILGDSTTKSESIARATEITANATQQLVGLNRGMLTALQALQNALGAAGNQLARGAGNADFPGLSNANYGLLGPAGSLNPLLDTLTSDPIGRAIGSFLWGGKQKVIDQGIVIAGGALQDMLENIVVGAYRTIKEDGGLFGSDRTFDNVVDISDSFGKQFQLVVGSIIDTVREGALALGLLPADVEAAIAAFQVAEIRISLKGLSAEDQQKELEAVFSQLFDGLAGSVVPFVEQFQAVGEGLGETLIRIATEVQVVQEGFRQLGLAVEQSDPEKFAQISDALIQAAGGIDSFVSGMQSFVANFASDQHQFDVASAALSSALDQVGLAVPATRDGMWSLMQSLDASTDAGREQIATLLRLADVANEYYNSLEAQAKKVADAAEYLDSLGLGNSLSKFGQEIAAIKAQERQAEDAAATIARAQGREAASTRQLAAIHDWASKQIAAALRRLATETRDIVAKLYGGVPASLDAVNDRIAELENSTRDATGGVADGIRGIADAGNDLVEQWRGGIKSLQDYLNSSLFGDLSTLTPEQQVAEARRQLDATIDAATRGDANALATLPQMMDQFARLWTGSQTSGADRNGVLDNYRAQLVALLGLQVPSANPNPGSNNTGGGGTVSIIPSPELQALYEQRDRLLADQEREYRAGLAQQLAQNLHDMAVLTRTPILDMIRLQDVALNDLATDMGVNLSNLTAESVLALGNMATTLGLSLTDLTGALGLKLTDLSGGVTALTQRLGIDLSNLTTSSTQTLADLANSLGGDLSDLAESVGIDLGSLTDKQGLLNQALASTIDELPAAQRDQLRPLLEAITNATTEADANAAIQALEAAVNATGGETAAALAPYLRGVFPPDALTDLDYLDDLQRIASSQLDVLKAIARGLDVPGYAIGTGFVMGDQLANIHHGEAVVPASVNTWFRSANWQLPRASNEGRYNDDRIVTELRRVNERLDSIERSNEAGHRKVADTVAAGDQVAQRQRHEQKRAIEDSSTGRSMRYG